MRLTTTLLLGLLVSMVCPVPSVHAETEREGARQGSQPPSIGDHLVYSVAHTGMTVEGLRDVLRNKLRSIAAVHFKKLAGADVLEEIYYEHPGKFKAVLPDAITILKDGMNYTIDARTHEIVDESVLSLESVDYLRSLRLESLQPVDADYRLEVFKVVRVPNLLQVLYTDRPADQLYLLAGYLRDPEGGPWPPRPRVDLFIDTSLGLIVAQRDYWIGGMAASIEDVELAQDIVVTAVREAAAGLMLPVRGTTHGYVAELSNLHENWTVEILTLNQDIPDEEFDLEAFKRSEDLDLDAVERWKKEFDRVNP